jgi:hypothetical protein
MLVLGANVRGARFRDETATPLKGGSYSISWNGIPTSTSRQRKNVIVYRLYDSSVFLTFAGKRLGFLVDFIWDLSSKSVPTKPYPVFEILILTSSHVTASTGQPTSVAVTIGYHGTARLLIADVPRWMPDGGSPR